MGEGDSKLGEGVEDFLFRIIFLIEEKVSTEGKEKTGLNLRFHAIPEK